MTVTASPPTISVGSLVTWNGGGRGGPKTWSGAVKAIVPSGASLDKVAKAAGLEVSKHATQTTDGTRLLVVGSDGQVYTPRLERCTPT